MAEVVWAQLCICHTAFHGVGENYPSRMKRHRGTDVRHDTKTSGGSTLQPQALLLSPSTRVFPEQEYMIRF